jgi:hypothetical protein
LFAHEGFAGEFQEYAGIGRGGHEEQLYAEHPKLAAFLLRLRGMSHRKFSDDDESMPVVPPDDPSAPHVDREPSIDPPPLDPDVEEPPDPPGGDPSAPQVTPRP